MRESVRLVIASASMAFLFCVFVSQAAAENWPSWRGPKQNGISTEKNIPAEWSRDKNVAWRLALPGPAGATPVVWDDRIFLTSADEQSDDGRLLLICVGTDGKEKWRREMGSGNRVVRNDEGNAASASPVTDGRNVWALTARALPSRGAYSADLACFSVDGREIWNVDLGERYGNFKIQFGITSTPVLADGRLYLQFIHGEGNASTHDAFVVALDAATGDEVWKTPRITGAHTENEHSYASPFLYDDGKLKFLFTHGADYTIAYDLETGDEIWRLGGLNPHDDPRRQYHPTLRFVASPATGDGLIVVPTAKKGPVFAIRPNGQGNLTDNSAIHVWTMPRGTPDVPSPLIFDGLVYLCDEDGDLRCLEAETGKELYLKRTHRIRHRASPLYADGKIYLTARDGKVSVVKAGRSFELLAQNSMEETTTASPVVSNGTLYLRTWDALWAIRNK